MKRMFDFMVAALLLAALMPVMILLALLVRINLGSPVFFRQTRPGLMGEPFDIYKFRTMTLDQDSTGNLLSDHSRMTDFGKFLRNYSLDELPQLLNVLLGDLSLVGPRPLLMEYLPLYSKEQWRRHEVRPGITGWAQVNGRNALSWKSRFELDVWYVDNRSFWLDIKILFMTVIKTLKHDGINERGEATMSKFTGNSNE